MNRERIIIGVSILFIVVILITASYVAFLKDEQQRQAMTSEVPAQIIDVFAARGRDPETGAMDRIQYIRINFSYEVNGATYRRVTTMNKVLGSKFKVGGAAKVCYKAGEPKEGELHEVSYECGK